ncbi:MAG: MCP four helix bundle domain-containing protein, partial [Bacteroidota bacterium]
MNSSLSLSTRAKLFSGFGLIIIAVIFMMVLTLISFKNIKNAQTEMIRSFEITQRLTELRSDENRQMLTMLQITISKDQYRANALKKVLSEKAKLIAVKRNELKQELQPFPDEVTRFSEIEAQVKLYIENREKRLALNDAGKMEESLIMASEVEAPLYENIRAMILAMEKDFNDMSVAQKVKTESLTALANVVILVGGFGMILLSVILIIWMIGMLRKISKEIRNGV